MEEKIMRLTLFVSSQLSPKTIKWLEGGPTRLRASRLLQYLEMNLTADENGGLLRPTRSDIGFPGNISSGDVSANRLLPEPHVRGLGMAGTLPTNIKTIDHVKPSVSLMDSIADELGHYET